MIDLDMNKKFREKIHSKCAIIYPEPKPKAQFSGFQPINSRHLSQRKQTKVTMKNQEGTLCKMYTLERKIKHLSASFL